MNPHLGGLPVQIVPGDPGGGLLWSVLLLAGIGIAVVLGAYVAARHLRGGRDAYAGAEAALGEMRAGGERDDEERDRKRDRPAGRSRP